MKKNIWWWKWNYFSVVIVLVHRWRHLLARACWCRDWSVGRVRVVAVVAAILSNVMLCRSRVHLLRGLSSVLWTLRPTPCPAHRLNGACGPRNVSLSLAKRLETPCSIGTHWPRPDKTSADQPPLRPLLRQRNRLRTRHFLHSTAKYLHRFKDPKWPTNGRARPRPHPPRRNNHRPTPTWRPSSSTISTSTTKSNVIRSVSSIPFTRLFTRPRNRSLPRLQRPRRRQAGLPALGPRL